MIATIIEWNTVIPLISGIAIGMVLIKIISNFEKK